jgi:hypothetical protein
MWYGAEVRDGVTFPCEIERNLHEGKLRYDMDSNHTDVGGRREVAQGG